MQTKAKKVLDKSRDTVLHYYGDSKQSIHSHLSADGDSGLYYRYKGYCIPCILILQVDSLTIHFFIVLIRRVLQLAI